MSEGVGCVRRWQAVLDEATNVKPDGFSDILQALVDGFALCVAAWENGTEYVVSAFLLFLENHGKMTCQSSPQLLLYYRGQKRLSIDDWISVSARPTTPNRQSSIPREFYERDTSSTR